MRKYSTVVLLIVRTEQLTKIFIDHFRIFGRKYYKSFKPQCLTEAVILDNVTPEISSIHFRS